MSNYGLHIQEIVSDTHRAVTNLTKQDAENRTRQLTRWHTTDREALHISELANECRSRG
jgi:3-methyladenine DNA glycosylase AlkC